jgi:uncharacterized protein YutD
VMPVAVAAHYFSDVQRWLATACSFGCNYCSIVRFAALLVHLELMQQFRCAAASSVAVGCLRARLAPVLFDLSMWLASIEIACDVAAAAAHQFSDVQRSLATACSFGCSYGSTVRFAALLLHFQLMVLVGSACSGAFRFVDVACKH